jgi:hypothetical protein
MGDRKGFTKKEEKQSEITITGDSFRQGKFASCKITINGSISKYVVSSLEHKNLINKANRYVKKVNSIHVEALKWYDKI